MAASAAASSVTTSTVATSSTMVAASVISPSAATTTLPSAVTATASNMIAKKAVSSSTSTHQSIGWDDLDLPRFYAAGFVAHLSARSILYPLNVIKTRQQTASAMGEAVYSGVGAAMKAIIRNEGVRSLWRGFGPSIFGAFAGAPYITALEWSKKQYILNLPRLGINNQHLVHSTASLLAGGTASMTTMVFTVPLEIISQRQQVERTLASRRSAIQIARTLLATDGIRGLWRGMPMALMTQAPGSALTWGAYESLKRTTFPLLPATSESQTLRDWVLAPLCAGAAGSISAVIMTPLDTLRTRQQVQERAGTTLMATWRDLIKQSGYRGLMAGAMPRVLSLGPSSMCMLSLFDGLKRFAQKDEVRAARPPVIDPSL